MIWLYFLTLRDILFLKRMRSLDQCSSNEALKGAA